MEIASGWQMVEDRTRPMDTEQIELRAAQSGDRAALERLLREQEGRLYTVCRGILGNTEDAEDAVQETFLRAIRNLHRFSGKSQLKTWLHRIAVNYCLDHKRSRGPVLPMEAAEQIIHGDFVERGVIF